MCGSWREFKRIELAGTRRSIVPHPQTTLDSEGNIADLGMDLFITSDLFNGKETDAIDSFGGGSMSADDHVAIEDRPSSDSEWIGLLIPTPKVSVNGSITEIMTGLSGQDVESCKWTSTFCATLGYGMKHLTKKYSTGELFPQSIQFVWNMTYDETGVVVNDQDVSVSGTTTKNAKTAEVLRTIVEIVESTTASSLFTIKNHSKLSVSGLDLRAIGKCGLFDLEADGDCLIVSDVGVVCSDGTEYWKALIKSSGRPVSIDSCTFNTSNGGPATLTHPLIQLVSPSTDVVPLAAITLRSVRISSFRSTRMIVEIDTDGPISVLNTLFSSQVDHERALEWKCCGRSGGELVLRTGSLSCFHFWPVRVVSSVDVGDGPSDTVLVSSNAHSSPHINCGSSALPCSTFEASLRSSTNHSIHSIVIAQPSLLELRFVTESSLTIQSQTGKQVLALQTLAQFGVDDDSTVLLLSSLEMPIDPTCSSSPVFLVSNGELHLSSSQISTNSLALLHSDVITLIKVLNAGTLQLTDSSIQNIQFTNPKQGTTIFLENDARIVKDSSSIFSAISSNGTGSLLFVCSDNLSQTATTSPLLDFNSTIPLPTNTLFSETEKNRFFGREGSDEWSLLYFWHPHTSGSVHINTAGQDHPNCGTKPLPCSSIVESQSKLKGEQKSMNLDTKSTLSSELVSTTTEWTLTQSSGCCLWFEGEGQLKISKSTPSKLTLSEITMEFGTLKEARTSAVMLIEEGWMILSLCEIGDGLSEIGISVGRVCGGSLTIGGTTMNLVSSTTPLFSTESGSLIVEESCSITHPASSRTAPLFSISGGSASLTSTTIPRITLSSSNSLISVCGSGSLSICDIDFDSMENSGSGAVLHFSSSGCLSLNRVNLNGSRCGSSGKGRSLFISRSDAFTLDNLHLRDVSVTQPTSLGTHEILIEGTSLESAACSDWKTFVGSDSSLLTRSTIVENWFENRENSSLSVPIAYLIFGRTTGAVHVKTDFWDHPNCGTEQLPCSTLLTAHNKLTEANQAIILESDASLSSSLFAKSAGSVISSESSLFVVSLTSSAQFSVEPSTSLTLTNHILERSPLLSRLSNIRSVSIINCTTLLCLFWLAHSDRDMHALHSNPPTGLVECDRTKRRESGNENVLNRECLESVRRWKCGALNARISQRLPKR
ncbi:hypothetical protein BLNAU_15200 [Blattamonas nauphoetae]|uniref:Uncharacterized protein n=1 Tax=Blattamonas nauphoetae TaxID=2049346 RepID=A0ABQ9XBJ4_9EUKA|nr:hypothetical protein BLNAU_15200 [Blattamonas nauphoetae]